MAKDSSSSPKHTSPSVYYCIECLEPCSTLYRQYTSSPSSIKLTSCSRCHKTVDPYIEREWLLVILDCVLLRVGAYRHVIFNRIRTLQSLHTNDDFEVVISCRKAVQYVFASVMLRTYLRWEALLYSQRESSTYTTEASNTMIYAELLVISLFQMMILWAGTCITALFMITKTRGGRTEKRLLLWRLYLAIVLPTTLNVVIVLILIWENTPTIRLLGSLFLLTYQGMAVSVVVQQQRQANQLHVHAGALPLAMGVLLQSYFLLTIRCLSQAMDLPLFSLEHNYPCVGLEMSVWFMKHELCLS